MTAPPVKQCDLCQLEHDPGLLHAKCRLCRRVQPLSLISEHAKDLWLCDDAAYCHAVIAQILAEEGETS